MDRVTSLTRPRAALLLASAALLPLAGCGTATPAASGSPSAASSGASSSAEPTGRPGTVVLTRSGGLAGHADRLDVAPDGTVTGATKAGAVSCRIDLALATALVSGPAPSAAPAAGADRMTITLDRLGTVVELGEGQGGDPVSEAVRVLLDDVAQPEDARTVCR